MAIEKRAMAPLLQVFDMPKSISTQLMRRMRGRGLLMRGGLRRMMIRVCTLGARVWMRRMRICVRAGLLRRSPRWRLMG